MDEYVVSIPVIKTAQLTPNPVSVKGSVLLTVTVEEITKKVYPEERYAGEFYCGE